jgi:drug/metabolite transporter (DMT)-like permease
MARSPRLLALLGLGVTLLVWSSAFVAIRVALRDLDPLQLTVARLVIASAALAAIAPLLGVRWPAKGDLGRIVLAGATGMTAYQLLLNTGEVRVPAGTASLLVATFPALTAVLGMLMLGERLAAAQWAGVAVAFAGAGVIALSGGGGLRISPSALLVLLAAACLAAYSVLQKPLLARSSPVAATSHATWVATALALPLAGRLPEAFERVSAAGLLALLWLGVGASAVGFVSWSLALRYLPASVAASSLYLAPPLTILISWGLLGERPAVLALTGGALCLLGVTLTRRPPSRRPRDRSGPRSAPVA